MKKLLFCLFALSFVFFSCSSDDDGHDESINLKTSNVTLAYGKEFQIEAASHSKITYSSKNEYHASVSSNGVIKGGRVGETNIVLTNEKDTKELKVTVKPEINLYPEPNVEFGISRSDLIKKLGTPDYESATGIGYYDYSDNAPQVVYLFDGNNKLTSSGILVKTSQSSNLGTFLGERYVPVASKDYTIFFINALDTKDASMVIGSNLYSVSYWMVVYMPNNTGTRSPANYLLYEETGKLFK